MLNDDLVWQLKSKLLKSFWKARGGLHSMDAPANCLDHRSESRVKADASVPYDP